MPIQKVEIKTSWTTDKVIQPLVEVENSKAELGVGVYNAHIDQSEPYSFKKSIRKVAVVGAGPAGVSTINWFFPAGCKYRYLYYFYSCLLQNYFLMKD